MNQLYYGDNLEIMRNEIPDESVDLCYIDPPFNSNRNYNLIYNDNSKSSKTDTAQAQMFVDTWVWDSRTQSEYEKICLNHGGEFNSQTSDLIIGLYKILGACDLMAYLVSMAVRVNVIRKKLKLTGSFYLHCDPTASHYLKLLLDAVFDKNFVNEITWKRSYAKGDAKQGSRHFGRITDTIFFYVKNRKLYTWNPQYVPYTEEAIKRNYKYIDPETNERYGFAPVDGPGGAAKGNPFYEFLGVSGYWRFSKEKMKNMYERGLIVKSKTGKSLKQKMYLSKMKGRQVDNFWGDINKISPNSKERLGYPTQKPEALLERIIKASSNEGDVVLDAFCGCGTTVAVAQKLGRNWIGIDISYYSISLIERRLVKAYGEDFVSQNVKIGGIPKDLESAKALALKKDDRLRKEFERWSILTYTRNMAMVNDKKGKDYGIDGKIRIVEKSDGETIFREVLFSVKSGKVSSAVIRDFRGVIERENSAFGVFITLNPPTKDMLKEAAQVGMYDSGLMPSVDKLQIVTVQDILDGEKINAVLAEEIHKSAQVTVVEDRQAGKLE